MADGPVTDLAKGIVGNEDWIRRWSIGQTGWHAESYDPYLVKNGQSVFGSSKQRVFLPLCGKSIDLAWFYDHGHQVLGVELAEQPVTEFFSENGMMYTVEDVDGVGKAYKNSDGRLHIIAADIFDVPLERYGKFDVIWDRRSFTAINVVDQIRYRDLMYDILKSGGYWYLNTVEYDESVWPGPPHSINNKCINQLFGAACSIELLEENNGKSINPNEHCLKKTDKQNEAEAFKNDSDGRPVSPTHLAISMSSFIVDRWYRLKLKVSE